MHTIKAGTGEKMQYLAHEFNDNTIRFILFYPAAPDERALAAAVRQIILSVDVLHGSFHADRQSARWTIYDEPDESEYFECLTAQGGVRTLAQESALMPIAAESRAKLFCTLIRGEKESALVVRMSHLCVDGGDGLYLLGKLAESYRAIRERGDASSVRIKDGSRAPEQAYAHLSRSEIRSLMKNPASGIKSVYPFPAQEAGEARMVGVTIPAQVMAAARLRAKSSGATVNDLLLTACYHAFAALPGIGRHAPVSIMSMVDLRRHSAGGISPGLCNLSGGMATALTGGICDRFEDTLAEIAAQTAKAKDDPLAGLTGLPILHGATRTLPLWLLLKAARKAYAMMSVGLTNLGNLRCGEYELDGAAPTGGLFAGPLKKKPSMQVSAASFDGACALCIAGEFTAEDEASLVAFLGAMETEIRAYAGCGE